MNYYYYILNVFCNTRKSPLTMLILNSATSVLIRNFIEIKNLLLEYS